MKSTMRWECSRPRTDGIDVFVMPHVELCADIGAGATLGLEVDIYDGYWNMYLARDVGATT